MLPNRVVVVIAFYETESYEANPELHEGLNILVPSKIPFFFGVAVFNFEGNAITLTI